MILYQPTLSEITAGAACARFRNPQFTPQINKAAAILADIDRNFDVDGDTWRVRSQSDSDCWHAVSSAGCSCTDYKFNATKVTPRHYYCKHLHAYYGYRRLLANALTRRMIGNIKFREERLRAQRQPGGWLAETDRPEKGLRAVAYSGFHHFPRHLCSLRLDANDTLIPLDVADYLAVAEWLARAPEFAVEPPLPRMEDYAMDYKPEWTPEWSHGDFKFWLDTGTTPAMRADTYS